MGFAAPRSFVAPSQTGYWFPPPASRLAVSSCAMPVLLWMPSPASLAQNGFILPQALRPYRVLLSTVRPTPPGVKLLPWGSHSLFAVSAGRILSKGFHPPKPFRPWRFSRLRRFPPPPALWVYFTPQPRPGFSLQGFNPLTQPSRLVDVPCPHVG